MLSTQNSAVVSVLRRITVLAALLVLVSALCLPVYAQSSPARAPQKWALLIGIDEYDDHTRISNLGAAAADARALKAALIEAGGVPAENITLLVSDVNSRRVNINLLPKRSNIFKALIELTEKVKPGDTVLVFYSGHGIEIKGKNYLLPYDTVATDVANLTDTAIETAKFKDYLEKVKAGTLILAFDMCRNDPYKREKAAIAASNTLTPAQVKEMSLSPGAASFAVTLYACSTGQQSLEWANKGRGYFSYFLEQGLRGYAADAKGTVRLDQLAKYVKENVEQAVLAEEHQAQTPFYGEDKSEMKNVILATNSFPTAPLVIDRSVTPAAVDTTATFHALAPANAVIFVDGMAQKNRSISFSLGIDRSRTVEVKAEVPGQTAISHKVTLNRGPNPPVAFDFDTSSDKSAAPASGRQTPSQAQATVPGDSASSVLGAPQDLVPLLRLTADGGAHAELDHDDDGSLRVAVTAVASANWRVRVTCPGMRLTEGHRYVLQFRVKAGRAGHKIEVQSRTADGDFHIVGLDELIQLDTDWQTFRKEFRALGVSKRGNNIVPYLSLGSRVGTIWITDVTLQDAGD